MPAQSAITISAPWPTAAALHPRVRQSLVNVVADRWEPELEEYNRTPVEEREGHLFQSVYALHNYLGEYSPITGQEAQS
ncbi:hypothetical protein ACWELJ_25915 [Nocardia sp. NPDC004582]